MSTLFASVEVGRDRWCMVWFPELPGLFVNASSERVAMRALPQAIEAYLRWLAWHGELGRIPRKGVVKVAERHTVGGGLRWGGYSALHAFEREPVTDEEITRFLRLMGCMRGDTLRLVEALPRGGVDWTRPGQERTIREHLRHIAGAERWYLQRLRIDPRWNLGRTRNPVERLARMRSMVAWRLMRLTPEECARLIRIDGEWWSARKMFGRFLYHERYHLRSLARIARHHKVRVPEGLAGWPRY